MQRIVSVRSARSACQRPCNGRSIASRVSARSRADRRWPSATIARRPARLSCGVCTATPNIDRRPRSSHVDRHQTGLALKQRKPASLANRRQPTRSTENSDHRFLPHCDDRVKTSLAAGCVVRAQRERRQTSASTGASCLVGECSDADVTMPRRPALGRIVGPHQTRGTVTNRFAGFSVQPFR
jgi:hypothetical protein